MVVEVKSLASNQCAGGRQNAQRGAQSAAKHFGRAEAAPQRGEEGVK